MSPFGNAEFGNFMAVTIHVGHYVQRKVAGLTLNVDTLWATAIAIVVVLGLGFAVRARATSGVPGRLQVIWELIIDAVTKQVESTIGPRGARIVPLAICLFFVILISNWVEMLPNITHPALFPAPTADVNTTMGYAFLVIILVHIASIREKGIGGYVGHYFKPYVFLFPVNVIEEVAKPFTLALRLFGNMFAGGLMLALIVALPWVYVSMPVATIWKLFDMGIGAIQAFIFALLTILYFEMGMTDAH
ncbi:MAG: F0F1 ATP synthase subunit A [Actinobacteria bacterium]|nr:F0F1 ATP synthase subunit A [Actinomycetota bacterium]MCL5447583.1 F0F1 ATP synthase subunit A [Actinomycetota bacterium]